jgi:hypothetical protein
MNVKRLCIVGYKQFMDRFKDIFMDKFMDITDLIIVPPF